MRLLRLPLYLWALPGTVVGLLLALASAARPVARDGVLDACGARGFAALHRKMGFGAITLGHVVVRSRLRGASAALADPRLWAHEMVHVRQWEVLGPLMLVLYPLLSVAGYRRNPFEVAARRRAGA